VLEEHAKESVARGGPTIVSDAQKNVVREEHHQAEAPSDLLRPFRFRTVLGTVRKAQVPSVLEVLMFVEPQVGPICIFPRYFGEHECADSASTRNPSPHT